MNTREVPMKKKSEVGQPNANTGVRVDTKARFTPRRFSVRGLRRHAGIKTSRNPQVAY